MRIQKLICLSVVVCLLLCLIGCGEKSGGSDTSDTVTASAPESTPADQTDPAPVTPASDPFKATFADMPTVDTPMVRLESEKDNLLFHFITPGMDSNVSRFLLYSLTEDTVLSNVDAGEGVFSAAMDGKGGFSVFDASRSEGKYYASDGTVSKTVTVSCIDGGIGFIAPGGEDNKMLVSEPQSGALTLVTPDGTQKTKVDLDAGAYDCVDTVDGNFIVTLNAKSVFLIGQDGSAQELFSAGTVQMANRDYAAGRIGDHFAFVPLKQGDCLFTKTAEKEETLLCSGDGVFLTSALKDNGTTLRLYRMATLKTAAFSSDASIEAAAVLPDGQIVIACRGTSGFTYQLLDPSGWKESAFSFENDLSAALGSISLPAPENKDETDAYTKEVLEQYNVRYLYESCDLIEGMHNVGIEAKIATDRAAVLAVEKHLTESFSFLPDQVWKNLGGELPFLVVLCDEIPGNAGGISFTFSGYNCICLEIGGNESYYTNTFFHEVGHAIENRVMETHPSLIDEWSTLTPKDVLTAVENGTVDGTNALTVEFTPDDKNGNVCYVSAYAQKNPEEDRAETLAKFHETVYENRDTSLFSHEVLKKKAGHWAKMIRATFSIPEDTPLPFDSL